MQVRKDELVVLTWIYNLSCQRTKHTMIKKSHGTASFPRVRMVLEK